MSDRRRRQQPAKVGLKKILRALAPACSEIISGCRTGSRTILRGDDCCKHLLTNAEYRYQKCFKNSNSMYCLASFKDDITLLQAGHFSFRMLINCRRDMMQKAQQECYSLLQQYFY